MVNNDGYSYSQVVSNNGKVLETVANANFRPDNAAWMSFPYDNVAIVNCNSQRRELFRVQLDLTRLPLPDCFFPPDSRSILTMEQATIGYTIGRPIAGENFKKLMVMMTGMYKRGKAKHGIGRITVNVSFLQRTMILICG
jgi:hypothetical protein